ncbi:hypothetical protein AAG570_008381 [Ranatra chinensis]|uniref:GMP phosphodiesterase delta subunit domain-containing protein n=1 Tax=Ranatra chinensis TaxID=642074 RepID=A0ABD0XT06_9HEMI
MTVILSDEELISRGPIRPEDLLDMYQASRSFLCPLEANIYGLDCCEYTLTDMDTGNLLFTTASIPNPDDPLDINAGRRLNCRIKPGYLQARKIKATALYSIGEIPINEIRLIERFYFRNMFLWGFDFIVGNGVPYDMKSVDLIYRMPKLPHHLVREMVYAPYATMSDSFYFADGNLVLHRKSRYLFENV